MILWLERLNELDHYLTLRREAEQYRILLHCSNAERPRMAHCRLLFWLGACLSSWGDYLQRHYGTLAQGRNEAEGSMTEYMFYPLRMRPQRLNGWGVKANRWQT